MKYIKLFARLVFSVILFAGKYSEGLQADRVLTIAQRMAIFGTNSTVQLPSVEFVYLKRLNATGLRSAGKRNPNLLQYRLTRNGEHIDFTLRQNKQLLTPGCLVHHYRKNMQKILYPCGRGLVGCLYRGRSDTHRDSWAAVNTCRGLKGVIRMKNSSFIIAPLHNKSMGNFDRENETHVLFRYTSDKAACMTPADQRMSQLHIIHRNKRHTRPAQFIESRVAVDPSAHAYHGNESEEFVQTVFNIASRLYEDRSLGQDIRLCLSEIHIYESYDRIGVSITKDAEQSLKDFCQWQARNVTTHPDCTVLLTRVNIEYEGFQSTVGLASHGMCEKGKNCAIVEDVGAATGTVIAHEIGHLLSMIHDEDTRTCKDQVGIMGTGSTGTNAFRWSPCSAAALKNFLSTNQSSCMANRPVGLNCSVCNNKSYPLPGTLYTRDRQCQLLFGNQYSYCKVKDLNVCDKLTCKKSTSTVCIISGSIVIDGTDCYNNRTWCISGICAAMDHDHSTPPVNGEWTDWDANYTPCSRTCGGGVKIKRRQCTNPPPQYGGKDCVGTSLQAMLCNMQSCLHDYKTQQCTEKGAHYNGTLSWRPMLAIGDESCLIWCETSDGKREIKSTDSHHQTADPYYKDGTKCDLQRGAPYGRCIDGRCRIFGCDGVMNSRQVYDNCNVCNGTGTGCRRIFGSYNKNETAKVFTTVVIIPKGSYRVKVWQMNMYCFLGVSVNGASALNNYQSHAFSGTYSVNGIRMKYTQNPEKVEIDGPTTTDVEIQVYRKYDWTRYVNVSPKVTYEYYQRVPSYDVLYKWSTQHTDCSKTCGTGFKTPKVRCVDFYRAFVEDSKCDIANKPNEYNQPCNTHFCPPRWWTSAFSSCSRTCGLGGKRFRKVVCLTENNGRLTNVSDVHCDVSSKPISEVSCTATPCVAVWKARPWTQCSKTCSEGIQSRVVKCFYQNGTLAIDSECGPGSKPVTAQTCTGGICPHMYVTSCKNNITNCKGIYGSDICYGYYSKWAELSCAKECGVCSPEDDPKCQELANNGTNICIINPKWADLHCQQLCSSTNCSHTDEPQCQDLASSDPKVCESLTFAKNICPHTCGMCDTCADTQDCSTYSVTHCYKNSQYRTHMENHCAKFCGFCSEP